MECQSTKGAVVSAYFMSELQQGQSFAHQSKLFTAQDFIIKSNMDPARTRWLSSSQTSANLAQIPSISYCAQMYEGPIVLESATAIGRILHALMMRAYYNVYIVYFPSSTHHRPEARFLVTKCKCRSNPVCISYQTPDSCCQSAIGKRK